MFQPGDLVDQRYDILGPLGQGGMAHVFRARDRHLERDVALKVLRPHLTEADSERFRREIRALARLNHPGVVAIYDLGLGEHVYFTMELIEGGPLTDLGPLEPDLEAIEKLLGAAVTVAEALHYVHRLGMVHRDLTPRNILLTRQGHPKVMDFGLVQLTEATRQLTRTGLTLGTPQYMAPEQARGDATGARTDLYAFGAVLYRTVTGVAPFEAENDQAVLYQHVYGELVAPADLNPHVPPALSDLILALLEKEPGRRPASGEAAAAALRAILSQARRAATHLPLGGPGRRGVYPGGPPWGRNLRRAWQVQLEDGPQWPSGLAAAQNFVLVGARSDELVVLHPGDGSVQARVPTPDEVSAPPLYRAGRLYLTSRDGALRALRWPSAAPLWEMPGAEATGILPHGSDLLLSSERGTLERLSAEREVRWRYELGAPAASPPLTHRGAVCLYTRDGWLHCADPDTGAGRFKVEIGPVAASPCAADGLLLLPVRSGELHAFDLATREAAWSYDLDGELWAAPVVANGRVYVGSWGSTIRCLSLRTGDDLWQRRLPARVTAAPVLASGTLYVATEGGELLALDPADGRVLWQEQVAHSPIQASPLPVGDAVVVAALDGTVAAFVA